MTSLRSCCVLAALGSLACRPDPGSPTYPDTGALSDPTDTGAGDGLPKGPDPYEAGEARLSLGLFYESGFSDLLEVNDQDRHYYIYSGTYTEEVNLQDVVEGRESTVIVHGTSGWFGGGVTWDVPQDLSAWTTLHVSLRSGDPGFAAVAIHVTGGGTESIVDAAAHGWVNDGEWHHLAIPMAEYAAGGTDLTSVTGPFVLIGEGGAEGESLKVDNLYFTQD